MTTTETLAPGIRIFIIDDHPLLREGMSRLISTEPDLHLCGETGRGTDALGLIQQLQPDLIILDLTLPDRMGLELIKDFRAAGVTVPILIVSMRDEVLYAERAIRAGANGYIMKEEANERVIQGIRSLMRGDIFLSEEMSRRMLKRIAGIDQPTKDGLSIDKLSDREFEIFELIGNGIPSRKIAEKLSISPKTVDAHRAHIKEKLGFRDGTELVRFAVRWVETGPDTP